MGDNCTIISCDAGNVKEVEFDIDVEFAKSRSIFVYSLGFSLCDCSSCDNGSIADKSYAGGNKSFVGKLIGDNWWADSSVQFSCWKESIYLFDNNKPFAGGNKSFVGELIGDDW